MSTINGGSDGWDTMFPFDLRLIIFVYVLGGVVLLVIFIVKCFRRNEEQAAAVDPIVTEADSLVPGPAESIHFSYGTLEDGAELGNSSESDDLYDKKVCAICYDKQRNCFFVPCGHCATCHECAQRIMEVENKICPICRRFIHKVKRLISS